MNLYLFNDKPINSTKILKNITKYIVNTRIFLLLNCKNILIADTKNTENFTNFKCFMIQN